MRPVAILTDSSSDLSPKYQDEYGIRLIKAHIRIPGNDDAEAFVTWEEGGTDRDLFYADLKKRPEAYATSPPNVQDISRALEELDCQGYDVVAITISSGISSS